MAQAPPHAAAPVLAVRPLAVLSTCDASVELCTRGPLPLLPAVRCHGQTVAVAPGAWSRGGDALRFTLPATGTEGVAYVALQVADGPACAPSLARPVVLTPHPALAAELAAGLAARAAATSEAEACVV
jgi:hypothetical protein